MIFIPTRYIHSHSTIMDRKDYDAAVRLLVELSKRLDRKTVEALSPFETGWVEERT